MDCDRRAVQAHRFEAQRKDLILLLPAKHAVPHPAWLRRFIHAELACQPPKCGGSLRVLIPGEFRL
jgi:hypothetical protein